MAEAARSKGSAAFAARDFAAALAYYSQSIDLDPRDPMTWSNRAICHYELGKHEEAISDGQRCLVLDPSQHKMYLCMGRAAQAMGDVVRAEEFYSEALKQAPTNPLLLQLQTQSTVAHMKAYFAKRVSNTLLEPMWFDRVRGKGFTARRDIQGGVALLRETPLASVRNVTCKSTLICCSHCLRTQLSEDELIPFPEIASLLSLPAPRWNSCAKCSDQYCSETCRDAAWKSYHALLCHGNNKDHPAAKLEAMARSLNRTNPLLIARIFAYSVQSLVSGAAKTWSHAFESFSMFVSNPEASPSDDALLKLIAEAIQLAAPSVSVSTYVTLQTYRTLNGAILRNASHIHTVSDVQGAIIAAHENGTPRRDVYKLIGCPENAPLDVVLQSEFLQSLCIEGTGLFAVANSFNHSCSPNLVLVSPFNCHDLNLLALSSVRQGQEVLISYIDETKSVRERQKHLQEMYHFTCTCQRCTAGT